MKLQGCKFLCLLIVILSATIYGQKLEPNGTEQKANLKKFTDNLRTAFSNRDYKTLANQMFTGKKSEDVETELDEEHAEKGIAVIKQLFEEKAADGMTFSVSLKSPQKIVAISDKLFAVVPQKTTILVAKDNKLKDANGKSVKPGKYIAEAFILAISDDSGKIWKFLSAFSEASFRNVFPETTGKMNFPNIRTPSFLIVN